jgi:crossover junction endodeoxyribonuclease RusA
MVVAGMSAVQIILPFPPSGLTPHAKGTWRKKAALTKSYRQLCSREAQIQGIRGMSADRIKARITIQRPNLKRDYQNCISCFKAGVDGIADVIGIDDRYWQIEFVEGELARPEGRVVVELEAA